MINRLKTISILVGLSAFSTGHAAIALINIAPAVSSISVPTTGTAIVNWDVINNTSTATTIYLNTLNGSGGSPANTTNGLSAVTDHCSDTVTPVGQGCTFTMGINGSGLTSATTIVSPVFCGFHGQACSQSASANRLTIYRTSPAPGPTPSGSWSVYSDTPTSLSFPEFLSIYGSSFAVGGLDDNYAPDVWICPITPDTCTEKVTGISDTATSLNALGYDGSGNLFGVFVEPYIMDPINPTRTYLMKLPAASSTWASFNTTRSGEGLGLDAQSSLGILSSSSYAVSVPGYGYPDFGSAQLYNSSGTVINAQTNTAASDLSQIVDAGEGIVYVAGTVSTYTISPTPASTDMIWAWNTNSNDPTTAFTAITMPSNISSITAMVSDGNGTLYVAGTDDLSDAHVWMYKNGTFSDTGLVAAAVSTLNYSPADYLLAGGTDNTDYNGAVWYYSGGSWTSLDLADSSSVASIAANAGGKIIVTGKDDTYNPAIWIYQ